MAMDVALVLAVVAKVGQLRHTDAPVSGMYVLTGHGVGAPEP